MARHDRSDGNSTSDARRLFLKVTVVAAVAALWLGALPGCGAKLPPGLFAAGRLGEFPISVAPRRVINTSLFVLHLEQGYAALSGECTHDGRAVGAVPEGGFVCPEDGSTFAADGTVTGGPATEDMAWFEVLLVDGELQIDPTVRVAKGTFVTP